MKSKRIIFFISLSFIFTNFSFGDFKEIKKKATVTQPEIIFPIQKDKKGCIKDLYISPDKNYVLPVLKVEAPSGYGLDNRFDYAKSKWQIVTCDSKWIERHYKMLSMLPPEMETTITHCFGGTQLYFLVQGKEGDNNTCSLLRFCLKPKESINSFHSLLERPEDSKSHFSPLIIFCITILPLAESSIPPTL